MTITFKADTALRRVLVIATFFVLGLAHWYAGKWGFANMASTRADSTEVADLAVDLAPGDPQTHYAAAVIYDRTFLAADQQRSLREYETSVALAPHNYLLWLEYGKALGRSGDLDVAETALRHAQALAPNYSAVEWTLGNLLIRKGATDEGFDRVRRAVESDATYAAPAAAFAYQFFNGDVENVRRVAGRSAAANTALALLLARSKRFDEAAEVWMSTDVDAGDENTKTAGTSLIGELMSAKKYRLAMEAAAKLDPEDRIAAGEVRDGGFEQGVKLENAGPFEWQISPGTQPQPLQSTAQPHGGSKSLVLRFSTTDGAGLRQLSQTVVVEPNSRYKFRGYYRSDLKSAAPVTCQVVNAASSAVLTELALNAATDWTLFELAFTAPADSDGAIVKLSLKPCGSMICPANGSVWLDDISIQKIN